MEIFSTSPPKIWVASSHFTEDKKIIERVVGFGTEGVVLKSALNLGSPCKRDCRLCQSPTVFSKKKRLFIATASSRNVQAIRPGGEAQPSRRLGSNAGARSLSANAEPFLSGNRKETPSLRAGGGFIDSGASGFAPHQHCDAGFTFYTFHENEACEYLFVDEVVDILTFLKKKYPHVFRVASIISKTQKDVLEMARLFEKSGAQAIEFNGLKYLEHGRVSKKIGKIDFLCSILKKLRSTVNIPVYIKVWPEALSENNFQKLSCWAEGATITNSFLTKNISVKLRQSIKEFRQKEEKEIAVHGEPLWQYVEEYIPKARKYFSYVSACGGIFTIERVKKAFALGADSVQLCSAIELHGPKFIRETQSALG